MKLSTAILALGFLVGGCAPADEPAAASAAAPPEARSARFELRQAALGNLRLQTVEAGPTVLSRTRTYPGTVRYRDSARAHVVAQVEGVVKKVSAVLGQRVDAGEIVCRLDSRELGRARAEFLGALSHRELTGKLFATESDLWQKKITPRDSYLQAQQRHAEAELAERTAEQSLRALGLTDVDLEELSKQANGGKAPLTEISYASPMRGEVVDVLVSQGEAVSAGAPLLEVADLSSVWVDMRVPAADLVALSVGAELEVLRPSEAAGPEEPGRSPMRSPLLYVAPEVDPASQTALARLELPNADGSWRPGLFVRVTAEVEREEVPLAVPEEALVASPDVPGEFFVFVQLRQGEYEALPVRVLRTAGGMAAVEGDLRAGDRVVTGETIFLKAVWMGEGGLEE